MDGRVRPVVGREQRERLLGPLAVGEVAKRLAVAELLPVVLAVADGRVVGLEREARSRDSCRGRDELGDLRDLLGRELAVEGRHAVPARPDLVLDGGLVRLQLVEIRADLALRVRGLERVAAAAPRAREHLAPRAGRAPAGAAAAGDERGESESDRCCGAELHDPVPRYDSPVAVTARPALDAQKLRPDFPIFEQKIHGKPLAYLDSARSSPKPRQVLDAMNTFYETSYTNVHRGVYTLSERATEAYEGAREKVRAFVNAPSAREVIFLRNATEALNLVAYSWGLNNLGAGDVVLVSELEHHSNFVPWQYMAKRTGADFRMLPLDEHGELRLEALEETVGDGNVKVVATNLVSNSLGTISPVEKLAAWAHERGAIYVCDAAQAAPHRPVDVQALGCDFVAVSGHKMCAPSGIGFLWGRAELLESMEPFLMGGHMIRQVRFETTTWG